MLPDNSEYLGVDAGDARVGIARGSGRARLAEPLMSVGAAESLSALMELIEKHQVTGIVIGLPRGLDGQETDQTHAVKQWAEKIKQQTSLACYLQDEALTSQKAGSYRHPSKTAFDDHSIAAAIILQDFLDAPVNNRIAV